MNTKKQGSISSYERLTEREKAIQLLEKVKQMDKVSMTGQLYW